MVKTKCLQKLAKVTKVMVSTLYHRFQVNISKQYLPLRSCTIESTDLQVKGELFD